MGEQKEDTVEDGVVAYGEVVVVDTVVGMEEIVVVDGGSSVEMDWKQRLQAKLTEQHQSQEKYHHL